MLTFLIDTVPGLTDQDVPGFQQDKYFFPFSTKCVTKVYPVFIAKIIIKFVMNFFLPF